MKNIHILPTDKPSRFYSTARTLTKKRGYAFGEHYIPNTRNMFSNHNIYITSDEEIKEGDWYFNNTGSAIEKLNNRLPSGGYFCKKIILTTDQDLIKDGVQAIDDEFLEWFVKNPSCEEVEIINTFDYIKKGYVSHSGYKIIIPKEELDYTVLLQPVGTKQETLEEAINSYVYKISNEQKLCEILENGIRFGAKCQQEQDKNNYSEEIFNILDNVRYWETCPDEYKIIIEKFIDKFKKK